MKMSYLRAFVLMAGVAMACASVPARAQDDEDGMRRHEMRRDMMHHEMRHEMMRHEMMRHEMHRDMRRHMMHRMMREERHGDD